MRSWPIIDMHADVFMDLARRAEAREKGLDPGDGASAALPLPAAGLRSGAASRSAAPRGGAPRGAAQPAELVPRHLNRIRAGGIVGAVMTDCRMAGEEAGPEHLERFIATVRRELAVPPQGKSGEVIHVRAAADLSRALSTGAFALIVGYEGLSATRGDLAWIGRLYREAGLRVAVLTHNDDNVFGGGAAGERGGLPPEKALGLTDKGRQALSLMNELGILVDMAHAGRATRRDILELSAKPVMLSHSSAKAVYDNGRNISDEEMRAIADSGGLIGCMTSPAALAPIGERGSHTLGRYMDHLSHMIRAAGVDHVGLGLHFCEYLYTPRQYPPVLGLEDASRSQAIVEALFAAGFSESDVEKITWKNFARVFSQAVG